MRSPPAPASGPCNAAKEIVFRPLDLITAAAAAASCLGVAACGGGSSMAGTPPAIAWQAVTGMPSHPGSSGSVATKHPVAAPSSAVRTSLMSGLDAAPPDAIDPASWVRPTSSCSLGVVLPAKPAPRDPVSLPPEEGVFYSGPELALWQQRIAAEPTPNPDALEVASARDWRRIVINTARFIASGEPLPGPGDEGPGRAVHGSLARDAAFHFLMTGDERDLNAVRGYLLAQAASPSNDYLRLCIRTVDGNTLDAWFWHASWLLRYMATYDFVRAALGAADRATIEASIRRNAYALAAHIDWGNAQIFPKRLSGDYGVRARDAAPKTEAETWHSRRYDTNGDCTINSADRPDRLPVHAYARADGSVGPRLSVLSQWFNNRKSAAAAAFGIAGAMLGDSMLVDHAKRYFMEWLSFAVWPDGSEGEFARNGDYCIAQQGVIYATTNLQGGLMLARALARQGDDTLLAFQTRRGLFGSESVGGQASKSLELVARTQIGLRTGRLDWYFHEAWKQRQTASEAVSLGASTSRYMRGDSVIDNYHELGLLLAAPLLPQVPVTGLVLRDPAVTSLRFPGATGNAVATGFGQWTDVFNALPAVLLLRP